MQTQGTRRADVYEHLRQVIAEPSHSLWSAAALSSSLATALPPGTQRVLLDAASFVDPSALHGTAAPGHTALRKTLQLPPHATTPLRSDDPAPSLLPPIPTHTHSHTPRTLRDAGKADALDDAVLKLPDISNVSAVDSAVDETAKARKYRDISYLRDSKTHGGHSKPGQKQNASVVLTFPDYMDTLPETPETERDAEHIHFQPLPTNRNLATWSRIPPEHYVYTQAPIRQALDTDEVIYNDRTRMYQALVFPSQAPSSRTEALHLMNTLESMLQNIPPKDPTIFVESDPRKLLGFSYLQQFFQEIQIYDIIFAEGVRQVYVHCLERGILMERIRTRYVELFASSAVIIHQLQEALERNHQTTQEYKSELERVTSKLSEAENAFEEERKLADEQIFQRELGKLRSELEATLKQNNDLKSEVAALREKLEDPIGQEDKALQFSQRRFNDLKSQLSEVYSIQQAHLNSISSIAFSAENATKGKNLKDRSTQTIATKYVDVSVSVFQETNETDTQTSDGYIPISMRGIDIASTARTLKQRADLMRDRNKFLHADSRSENPRPPSQDKIRASPNSEKRQVAYSSEADVQIVSDQFDYISKDMSRSITTAELKFMKMAQGAKDDEDAQSLDRFSQMGSLDVTGGSTMQVKYLQEQLQKAIDEIEILRQRSQSLATAQARARIQSLASKKLRRKGSSLSSEAADGSERTEHRKADGLDYLDKDGDRSSSPIDFRDEPKTLSEIVQQALPSHDAMYKKLEELVYRMAPNLMANEDISKLMGRENPKTLSTMIRGADHQVSSQGNQVRAAYPRAEEKSSSGTRKKKSKKEKIKAKSLAHSSTLDDDPYTKSNLPLSMNDIMIPKMTNSVPNNAEASMELLKNLLRSKTPTSIAPPQVFKKIPDAKIYPMSVSKPTLKKDYSKETDENYAYQPIAVEQPNLHINQERSTTQITHQTESKTQVSQSIETETMDFQTQVTEETPFLEGKHLNKNTKQMAREISQDMNETMSEGEESIEDEDKDSESGIEQDTSTDSGQVLESKEEIENAAEHAISSTEGQEIPAPLVTERKPKAADRLSDLKKRNRTKQSLKNAQKVQEIDSGSTATDSNISDETHLPQQIASTEDIPPTAVSTSKPSRHQTSNETKAKTKRSATSDDRSPLDFSQPSPSKAVDSKKESDEKGANEKDKGSISKGLQMAASSIANSSDGSSGKMMQRKYDSLKSGAKKASGNKMSHDFGAEDGIGSGKNTQPRIVSLTFNAQIPAGYVLSPHQHISIIPMEELEALLARGMSPLPDDNDIRTFEAGLHKLGKETAPTTPLDVSLPRRTSKQHPNRQSDPSAITNSSTKPKIVPSKTEMSDYNEASKAPAKPFNQPLPENPTTFVNLTNYDSQTVGADIRKSSVPMISASTSHSTGIDSKAASASASASAVPTERTKPPSSQFKVTPLQIENLISNAQLPAGLAHMPGAFVANIPASEIIPHTPLLQRGSETAAFDNYGPLEDALNLSNTAAQRVILDASDKLSLSGMQEHQLMEETRRRTISQPGQSRHPLAAAKAASLYDLAQDSKRKESASESGSGIGSRGGYAAATEKVIDGFQIPSAPSSLQITASAGEVQALNTTSASTNTILGTKAKKTGSIRIPFMVNTFGDSYVSIPISTTATMTSQTAADNRANLPGDNAKGSTSEKGGEPMYEFHFPITYTAFATVLSGTEEDAEPAAQARRRHSGSTRPYAQSTSNIGYEGGFTDDDIVSFSDTDETDSLDETGDNQAAQSHRMSENSHPKEASNVDHQDKGKKGSKHQNTGIKAEAQEEDVKEHIEDKPVSTKAVSKADAQNFIQIARDQKEVPHQRSDSKASTENQNVLERRGDKGRRSQPDVLNTASGANASKELSKRKMSHEQARPPVASPPGEKPFSRERRNHRAASASASVSASPTSQTHSGTGRSPTPSDSSRGRRYSETASVVSKSPAERREYSTDEAETTRESQATALDDTTQSMANGDVTSSSNLDNTTLSSRGDGSANKKKLLADVVTEIIAQISGNVTKVLEDYEEAPEQETINPLESVDDIEQSFNRFRRNRFREEKLRQVEKNKGRLYGNGQNEATSSDKQDAAVAKSSLKSITESLSAGQLSLLLQNRPPPITKDVGIQCSEEIIRINTGMPGVSAPPRKEDNSTLLTGKQDVGQHGAGTDRTNDASQIMPDNHGLDSDIEAPRLNRTGSSSSITSIKGKKTSGKMWAGVEKSKPDEQDAAFAPKPPKGKPAKVRDPKLTSSAPAVDKPHMSRIPKDFASIIPQSIFAEKDKQQEDAINKLNRMIMVSHKPMAEIIEKYRHEVQTKSIAWLHKKIRDVYTDKMIADLAADREQKDRYRLPDFLLVHFKEEYGTQKLVEKQVTVLILTMQLYRGVDVNVEMFAKFVEETWDIETLTLFLKSSQLVNELKTGLTYPSSSNDLLTPKYVDLERCRVVSRDVLGDRQPEMVIGFEHELTGHSIPASEEDLVQVKLNTPRFDAASQSYRKVLATDFLELICQDHLRLVTAYHAYILALFDEHKHVNDERLRIHKFEVVVKQAFPELAQADIKSMSEIGIKLSEVVQMDSMDLKGFSIIMLHFNKSLIEYYKKTAMYNGRHTQQLDSQDRNIEVVSINMATAAENNAMMKFVEEKWKQFSHLYESSYRVMAMEEQKMASSLRIQLKEAVSRNSGYLAAVVVRRILLYLSGITLSMKERFMPEVQKEICFLESPELQDEIQYLITAYLRLGRHL